MAFPSYDTKDMANGIEWIIEDGVRARELSKNARQIAIEKYNPELIANRYLEVYKKILSQNKNIKND